MAATIDQTKCIGCGTCAEVCPNEAIDILNGCATLARREDCEGCGICMEFCEQEAILVKES